MFEIHMYGEEIPGVVCPDCGGTLVTLNGNAYCDWCAVYVPLSSREAQREGTEDD